MLPGGFYNLRRRLTSKVVVQYVLRWNSEAVKQCVYRLDHHRRTAHEVFDILWSLVLLKICLVHHIVNETCNILDSCFICCRIRTVESKVEVEVRELFLDFSIVFEVECFLQATCTIEEVDLLLGLEGLEEMHDVASERSHTCTTTDEDVFL